VQEVGSRIRDCCRSAEPGAVVARLGGDEFTVILPDLRDPEAAARLARTLLNSFHTPFALDGHEVFVSASVGIATYPADGPGSGKPAQERGHGDVSGQEERPEHGGVLRDSDGHVCGQAPYA
jgi:GGDEF domain-containing protein